MFTTSGRAKPASIAEEIMSFLLLAKFALVIWTVAALIGLAFTTWLEHRQLAAEE